jgi:hypothetical protein
MELEQRAQAGDAAAQLALAARHEADGVNEMARGWMARAVRAGHPDALRLLAASLMVREPANPDLGGEMMRSAALQGDAEAAFICAAIAGQADESDGRWLQALQFLAASAQAGSAPAGELLELLGARDPAQHQVAAQHIIAGTRRAVEWQRQSPRIALCKGFASAAECHWMMARAQARLKPAEVYDPVTGQGARHTGLRTNSDTAFDITQSDLALVILRARIAAITGACVTDMEPAMVLHYTPGQYFAPHFDWLDPQSPGMARDIAEKGQRRMTFLLYLNDDYEGGETEFPDLGWRYRGQAGDALFFWNVDAAGQPDTMTRHAGTAPTRGQKWVLSQWIRDPAPAQVWAAPPPANSAYMPRRTG